MADVRPLLLSVLRALERLHADGKTLYTLELKVENMSFDRNGEVAWKKSYQSSYQRGGLVSVFDSPEVLLDPNLASGGSKDVWAFGCFFSFLLRGSYMFHGTTKNSVLADIFSTNLEQAGIKGLLPAHASKEAVDMISKCLHRVPRDRPSLRYLLQHPYFRTPEGDTMAPKIVQLVTAKVKAALWRGTSGAAPPPARTGGAGDSNDQEKVMRDWTDQGEESAPASEREVPRSASAAPTSRSSSSENTHIDNGCTYTDANPLVRDNVLHVSVETLRLSSAAVGWAALRSQAACKNVYIMLSVNVWKTSEDANNNGKKFYANKWCNAAHLNSHGDGQFSATIAEHFRYDISSDQLFGSSISSRSLTLIVLVRVENEIVGSAIISMANVGKMGQIDGWYHITSGGKCMGQVKVIASPTLPSAVDIMHLPTSSFLFGRPGLDTQQISMVPEEFTLSHVKNVSSGVVLCGPPREPPNFENSVAFPLEPGPGKSRYKPEESKPKSSILSAVDSLGAFLTAGNRENVTLETLVQQSPPISSKTPRFKRRTASAKKHRDRSGRNFVPKEEWSPKSAGALLGQENIGKGDNSDHAEKHNSLDSSPLLGQRFQRVHEGLGKFNSWWEGQHAYTGSPKKSKDRELGSSSNASNSGKKRVGKNRGSSGLTKNAWWE